VNAGGSTNYEFIDFGNTYASSIEAPNVVGPSTSKKAIASAWANFAWNGSAIVVSDSYNVPSIVRSNAGVYVINFALPMLVVSYAPDVSFNSSGFAWASNPTLRTVTVNPTNPPGSAFDPTQPR
jgi:hypothetical protein